MFREGEKKLYQIELFFVWRKNKTEYLYIFKWQIYVNFLVNN